MNAQRLYRRSLEDLPRAIVEKNWKSRLFWFVPLGAAALAAYFIYSQRLSAGPTVHIFFEDAQGLEAGKTELKYRGTPIGVVKSLRLTQDHQQVQVTASLDKSAANMAREGSRFWIVKAEIGVAQIRALQTIVSGNFVAIEPGTGKPQITFIGLEQPPVVEPKGVVRIILLSERLGAMKPRSPVFYRGFQVGEVFSCELGPDSQTVQINTDIPQHYAPLVRMNSRFWNAGGVHVNIGLSGADISAQSAQTLVSGGIDFATPDTTEKPAPAGTAFRLYDKPEDAWLSWAPRIELNHEPAKRNPELSQSVK